MKLVMYSTTALSALMISAVAHAQQDVDAGLQDIIVTAQKRSENLQNVPIVVTSISDEKLRDSGITNLAQINTLAPGLTTRQSGGSLQTTIRGIGPSTGSGESPAALYIDDVYLPSQRDGLRELLDIQQVSVLKGPQGTLFGRNSTAGVVQITTRQPTQDFTFMGDVGYGNYETVRTNSYISGGLGAGLAASLSMQYDHQGEGYGKNLVTGKGTSQLLHSFSTRGKIVYEPTDTIKFTLIGDYLDRSAHLHDIHQAPGTTFFIPVGPLGNPRDLYSQIDSKYKYKSGGVSLAVEKRFDFATLKSISAYRTSSAQSLFDALPQGIPAFYVGYDKSPQRSSTQELQLISTGNSTLTWTVGAFYFHATNSQSPSTNYLFSTLFGFPPPAFLALRQDIYAREKINSVAAYAQADIKLFPNTTLTLGGRYTYEKRDIAGSFVNTQFGGAAMTLPTPAPQSLIVNKPTWRIALNHKLTHDIMIYASYNRGFKSGGFNLIAPGDPGYKPEKIDAYEAGIKTELFDRRLRLNIGGFYYDYTNIQITQFVNGPTPSITNGAKARVYGLDGDLEAKLGRDLTLTGGISIVDGKFTEYLGAPGRLPRGNTPIGVPGGDASGFPIPGAQKFTGTATLKYSRELPIGSMNLTFTTTYNSKYSFEPDNFIQQNAYVMLNTSARWTSKGGHYSLAVWGQNLGNELIATGGATVPFGSLIAYEAPPRTYGITAGIKF